MSKHPFKTEAELCAAFIEYAQRGEAWTAYAETCGWDILLVRKADGFQIGIQAKLNYNMKVLSQCLETWHNWREVGGSLNPTLEEIMTKTAQFMKGHLKP